MAQRLPLFYAPCKQHKHDLSIPSGDDIVWDPLNGAQNGEIPFLIPPGRIVYRWERDPRNVTPLYPRERLKLLAKKDIPNSLWVYRNTSRRVIHARLRKVAAIKGTTKDPNGGSGGGYELLVDRADGPLLVGTPASKDDDKFDFQQWKMVRALRVYIAK